MSSLRILQFSDAHLDSPLSSTKLRLPPEKRKSMRAEIMRKIRQLPDLVKSHGVDAVLCPGDLWEDEAVKMETAAELFEVFESLRVPVVIAPGNHDYFHALSYYARGHFERKVGRPFPKNVHVFTASNIEPLTIEGWRSDVVFYGSCFTEADSVGRHPAFTGSAVDKSKINIALVHGSLIDVPLFAADLGRRDQTYSFSTKDILQSDYDYVALGHYHAYSQVEAKGGRIRAAYSGVLVSRSLDETRDHFVIIAEVEAGGVAPANWHLERVDTRRILELRVALDPEVRSVGEILRRIREAFDHEGVGREDIVYVRLQGQLATEFERYELDERELEAHCWHAVVDWSEVEPAYDLEAIRNDSASSKVLLGQFLAAMDRAEEEAQRLRDSRRLEIIREARLLGLDALHGKEIQLRYAVD